MSMGSRAYQPRELTDRQAEILLYLYRHTAEHGFQPSYKDMSAHFGIRSTAISGLVHAIARKGYLQASHQARALRLVCLPDGTPFHGFRLVSRDTETA